MLLVVLFSAWSPCCSAVGTTPCTSCSALVTAATCCQRAVGTNVQWACRAAAVSEAAAAASSTATLCIVFHFSASDLRSRHDERGHAVGPWRPVAHRTHCRHMSGARAPNPRCYAWIVLPGPQGGLQGLLRLHASRCSLACREVFCLCLVTRCCCGW